MNTNTNTNANANTPQTSTANSGGPEREVFIERCYDFPRELVSTAWTDPGHLVRRYAPRGCEIEFRELDVRPGGAFLSCIRSPEGHECWCKGDYLEMAPPERIVMTMEIADEHGNSITVEEAGMDPEWPRKTVATITFEEINGGRGTKLTLRQTVSEALAKRTGAYPSWLEMLDRLEEVLGAEVVR